MSEQTKFETWRDVFTAIAKSGGVDIQDADFADFIQSDQFGTPIRAESMKDLKKTFDAFVFSFGQKHKGLDDYFGKQRPKEIYGKILEQSERAVRQAAEEMGFDKAGLDQIISQTQGGDHVGRWKGIADFFQKGGYSKGQAEAKDDRGDKELKTEIKRLENLLQTKEKEWTSKETTFAEKLTAAAKEKDGIRTFYDLERQVRGAHNFRKDLPASVIDNDIKARIQGLMNQYNIIKNGTGYRLYDKADPTQVIRDPETNHELTLDEVLTGLIPEGLLDKQPGGGDPGGNPPPITITPPKGFEPTAKGNPTCSRLHKGRFSQAQKGRTVAKTIFSLLKNGLRSARCLHRGVLHQYH